MYRRNLPHWHPSGKAIFITWRLAGSFPRAIGKIRDGRAFVEVDRALEPPTHGPQWLRDPQIAQAVIDPLRRQAESNCDLHAFVVMPNHVHILITPGIDVSRIMNSIKGASARRANAILNRTGKPFWQDESFDHWVRNPGEFGRIVEYIENNPVKAGLAVCAEQWPYSSAAQRKKDEPFTA